MTSQSQTCYSILIKKSAAKEIRAITRKADRQRILERIEALAENPRPPGCKKLSGGDAYRVRQGRFRIVYTIEDAVLVVQIVKVGDRQQVYR